MVSIYTVETEFAFALYALYSVHTVFGALIEGAVLSMEFIDIV